MRLSQFLDGIAESPDGMPPWTTEERKFLSDMARLKERPLAEWQKRIAVAQARMIGDL
jgi:hypothetical protein